MKAIADLARLLARTNSEALSRFEIPIKEVVESLADTRHRLSAEGRRSDGGGMGANDLSLRIREAIENLRQNPSDISLLDLRLACLGITKRFEEDGYVLMCDEPTLSRLLKIVDGYSNQPLLFRRLYHPLLTSYFALNKSEEWAQAANTSSAHERLRDFLEQQLRVCCDCQVWPDWLEAISEHGNILGPEPGKRYARGLLAKEPEDFRAVCERLGITSESWLPDAVLGSAVRMAVDGDDDECRNAIEPLLLAVADQRFAAARSWVLAALLDRFCDTKPVTAHVGLRDTAVTAWKNPWLATNEASWSRVRQETKHMVASWLKLDLIREFFEVLSGEKGSDSNRFHFWKCYHKQITDIYFVLGFNALRSPDFKKMRDKLDGRHLRHGGAKDNNAFIMQIGDVSIVEFSAIGNAAYVHLDRAWSFDGRDSLEIREDLRDGGEQWPHTVGKGGQTWQARFENDLANKFGIFPDGIQPRDRRERPSAGGKLSSFSDRDFLQYIRTSKLKAEDNRRKGGSLWVRAGDGDSEVTRQLTAWGFTYRAGKGWWKA